MHYIISVKRSAVSCNLLVTLLITLFQTIKQAVAVCALLSGAPQSPIATLLLDSALHAAQQVRHRPSECIIKPLKNSRICLVPLLSAQPCVHAAGSFRRNCRPCACARPRRCTCNGIADREPRCWAVMLVLAIFFRDFASFQLFILH